MPRIKPPHIPNNVFADPAGEYPRQIYWGESPINKAAKGMTKNYLYYGGSDKNVKLNLPTLPPSTYPNNQVKQTASGHVTEYDDTINSERILIKHKSGAGVEIRPDGTIIISGGPEGNLIQVAGGDHQMIIERDGQISYNGNLSLDVNGNFDLNVKDFNLKVRGNYTQDIDGSKEVSVEKNQSVTVKGGKQDFALSGHFEYIREGLNQNVKGGINTIVEGESEFLFKNNYTLTAEQGVIISTKNANIAASSMTLIGDSGTVGGGEIVMYGKGATFSEGVTAQTFHGALEGNAKTATEAGKAGTAGGLGPGGSAGTEVNVATPVTVNPTSDILSDYLDKSNFGIRRISIDPNDVIYNSIVLTEDFGLTSKRLTTAEVRSKLRDPVSQQNDKFIGGMVADLVLSSTSTRTTPLETGNSISKDAPITGKVKIGYNLSNYLKTFQGKSKLL